jgi:hypothetical protein
VLGADPLSVAGEEIAAIPVLETWVDGIVKHTAAVERNGGQEG